MTRLQLVPGFRRSVRPTSIVKLLVALVVVPAVLGMPGSGRLRANGDSVEIYRERGGPFELVVGVQPKKPAVGPIHLTLSPLDAATSEPVLDAEIEIVAHTPDGDPEYRVRALSTPGQPRYYDANLAVESAGRWTLVVDVRSDSLGRATFSVPVQVIEQSLPPSLAGTVLWLGVSLVVAGGAAYVWYSSRGARDRHDA